MKKIYFKSRLWVGFEVPICKLNEYSFGYEDGIVCIEGTKIEGLFRLDYIKGKITDNIIKFELFDGSSKAYSFEAKFNDTIYLPDVLGIDCLTYTVPFRNKWVLEVEEKISDQRCINLFENKIADYRKIYN